MSMPQSTWLEHIHSSLERIKAVRDIFSESQTVSDTDSVLTNATGNGQIIDMIKHSSRSFYGVLYAGIKRLFDIVFSSLLLILSSPLWLISVIGIKFSSPGPIFYVARRVGMDGRAFNMLKFRSMRVDNGANEKSLRPEQDRISKFGKLIRAAKIDELPQVLNVFLGQMSVVGPRPAAEEQVSTTRGGKYKAIYAVKAGLTSPSALYDYIFGDLITDEDEYKVKVLSTRLDLDLYYLKRRGMLYDLKMVVYTVLCIIASILRVQPKGIYYELVNAARGVQENNEPIVGAVNS